MNNADRTIRATGTARIAVKDNRLMIEGQPDGQISVAVGQAGGVVVLAYHPLSGWYSVVDTRGDAPQTQESQ